MLAHKSGHSQTQTHTHTQTQTHNTHSLKADSQLNLTVTVCLTYMLGRQYQEKQPPVGTHTLRMGGDFCIYVQLIKINGKKKEWEEMRGLG